MARLRAVDRVPTVAILLFDGFHPFEMSVACEVFGIDRTDWGVPPSRVIVCAAKPEIRAHLGFVLRTDGTLNDLARADTVIVPTRREGNVVLPEERRALLRAHRRGARIVSFCSGSFVLAEVGLLSGRTATTHWLYADEFAARYPDVTVDVSVLYRDCGDRIYTSAGTAAAIDLCLHLVREDHGAEAANIVARRMVVPAHRHGGQAQYVETPVASAPEADPLAAVLDWAVEHLDQELTVEMLARRAGMSPRTLARRFKETTGTTPLQWLLTQRVVAAQRMLETTTLSVERIAELAGFGSAANLRQHFARMMGTSPQAYRRMFARAG